MYSTSHRRTLHLHLATTIYAALIEPSPNNPPAIKDLHIHMSSAQIYMLASHAADAIVDDPTIKIVRHRSSDQ